MQQVVLPLGHAWIGEHVRTQGEQARWGVHARTHARAQERSHALVPGFHTRRGAAATRTQHSKGFQVGVCMHATLTRQNGNGPVLGLRLAACSHPCTPALLSVQPSAQPTLRAHKQVDACL